MSHSQSNSHLRAHAKRGVPGARLLAAALLGTALVSGQAMAQTPPTTPEATGEDILFKAPAGATGLLKEWDSKPYLGVLGACLGVVDAYETVAATANNAQAVNRAKGFSNFMKRIILLRTANKDIWRTPDGTPAAVSENYKVGYGTAVAAARASSDRAGVILIENTAGKCVEAVRAQEATLGKPTPAQ